MSRKSSILRAITPIVTMFISLKFYTDTLNAKIYQFITTEYDYAPEDIQKFIRSKDSRYLLRKELSVDMFDPVTKRSIH